MLHFICIVWDFPAYYEYFLVNLNSFPSQILQSKLIQILRSLNIFVMVGVLCSLENGISKIFNEQ